MYICRISFNLRGNHGSAFPQRSAKWKTFRPRRGNPAEQRELSYNCNSQKDVLNPDSVYSETAEIQFKGSAFHWLGVIK